MARRYFGTDGVRGVVGEFLTPELVERLGRAAALWSGAEQGLRRPGHARVGRRARGGVRARGRLGRRRLRRSAACCRHRPSRCWRSTSACVITASHNPPEYNGVKFFDGRGRKLTDESEEQIEALLAAPPAPTQGAVEQRRDRDRLVSRARARALRLRPDRAAHRRRLRERRVLGPRPARRSAGSAPRCTRSPTSPTARTSTSAAARPTRALLQRTVRRAEASTSASRSTATATGCSRSTSTASWSTATRSSPILALDLGVDLVAVTVMTNLGFHALMRERGIRVVTTDVGDRYVLEALAARGRARSAASSRATSSACATTSPATGCASALLLCAALKGRTLSEAAAVMPRFPQVKENVRVAERSSLRRSRPRSSALNAEWDGRGRVLVRASGTEPLIRVLVEAENEEFAAGGLC